MIVFPAIDLRRGMCVRLQQGAPDAETVYSDDPVATALRWEQEGQGWLHMVNLDGALSGSMQADLVGGKLPLNLRVVRQIAERTSLSIQLGGGLRSLEDIDLVLALGVRRVVLGTVAVREPGLVSEAIERFGAEQIVVGIDARDGWVTTLGWQETSTMTAVQVGREMAQRGIRRLVYTDITRDGMLGGVNVSATAILAMQTGLRVIASGGVASLDDIHALKEIESTGVEGVIVGKALYTGDVELSRAVEIASAPGGRVSREES